MWNNDKKSMDLVKRITDQLTKVWPNKEFIVEVLKALENHEDECEDFILFLEKSPGLVPSEIYEIVSAVTDGSFIKEISKVCAAKNQCIANPCDENWRILFEILKDASLFYACEWDISDDEKTAVLQSDVGDTVHIETKTRPVLLRHMDTGEVIIPVYTSEYEIKREYRSDEYALETDGWSYALKLYEVCKDIFGRAVIVLDIDSDKCLEIKLEKIEGLGIG